MVDVVYGAIDRMAAQTAGLTACSHAHQEKIKLVKACVAAILCMTLLCGTAQAEERQRPLRDAIAKRMAEKSNPVTTDTQIIADVA